MLSHFNFVIVQNYVFMYSYQALITILLMFNMASADFLTLILQDSGILLAGEKGVSRLIGLQKMLRVRQQHMISQVAYLYPIKILIGASQELELDSFPSGSRSGAALRRSFPCFMLNFVISLMLGEKLCLPMAKIFSCN